MKHPTCVYQKTTKWTLYPGTEGGKCGGILTILKVKLKLKLKLKLKHKQKQEQFTPLQFVNKRMFIYGKLAP